MKDNRNHHDVVGKSSLEQHCNCVLQQSGGTVAGRQMKYRWIFKFLKLAVSQNIRLVTSFNQGTASLQPYQCIPAGFSGKAY